ncbi:MAG: glycosyltransferase family 2 protein, partial [Candidatus Helarchaeota archaeon]|nr:glycosyltransferase family 2 protein [Candidatus Helarchaeota archaeon]
MGVDLIFKPVSIIVPIKNRGSLLPNLVRNLLKIDYPKFEVIIIDDNSTDGTKELLKKLHASKKFSIRCILLKKSVGSAKARNIGIVKAKYDIIALTDSDCIVSKNWLKDLIPYLEKYDLIGGKVKYMDQAEDKMNPFQKIKKIISIKQNSLINFLNTNNLIFKR